MVKKITNFRENKTITMIHIGTLITRLFKKHKPLFEMQNIHEHIWS